VHHGDVVMLFADVDTDVQVAHVSPPRIWLGGGWRRGPAGGVPVRSFDEAIGGFRKCLRAKETAESGGSDAMFVFCLAIGSAAHGGRHPHSRSIPTNAGEVTWTRGGWRVHSES